MTWMQFVAAMVSALSWPVSIMVCIWLIRREFNKPDDRL
jgi:hypothetical protein